MYPVTFLEWWHDGEWHRVGWTGVDPTSTADLRRHGEALTRFGGSYRLVQPHPTGKGVHVVHDYSP